MTMALLLLTGCGLTLDDVGDGAWDMAVWAVEGTGKVAVNAATVSVGVAGTLVRGAIDQAGRIAEATPAKELPLVASDPAITVGRIVLGR